MGGGGTEKEQMLRTQRTRGSSPDHWASVTGYGEGGTLRISVKGVLLRFEKKNYLKPTEAILWNIQINLPTLERQKKR